MVSVAWTLSLAAVAVIDGGKRTRRLPALIM